MTRMQIFPAKAVGSMTGNASAMQAQGGSPISKAELNGFFRKRRLIIVVAVLICVALSVVSAIVAKFDVVKAIVDFPEGFVWFVSEFMPTPRSFEYLDTILPALFSTFLDSVAAGTTAAIFAYIFAVLGSRSVGLGGPIPLFVRAVASVFRNIPIVAWAFLLLFSFKQSEFTGFLALFLQSFGFLTRSFLEGIDEMSMGPVEALRSTGATYLQIIVHAVIPLTITQVVSWLLYMVETNIRDATLVGMLTGTGIGFVFDMYYKSMRYDISGLVLVCVVIIVIACETTSNYIRRRVQ